MLLLNIFENTDCIRIEKDCKGLTNLSTQREKYLYLFDWNQMFVWYIYIYILIYLIKESTLFKSSKLNQTNYFFQSIKYIDVFHKLKLNKCFVNWSKKFLSYFNDTISITNFVIWFKQKFNELYFFPCISITKFVILFYQSIPIRITLCAGYCYSMPSTL